MEKVLCILIFSFALSSNSVGQESLIGLSSSTTIGGLKGFSPAVELSFGKFYAKNFAVGLNVNFHYSPDPIQRMKKLNEKFGIEEFPDFSQGLENIKSRDLSLGVFSKYYISDFRLRPFIYGELGTSLNLQKVIGDNGTFVRKSSALNLDYELGAGFSYGLNKKRSLVLEASYGITNEKPVGLILWDDSKSNFESNSAKLIGQFKVGLQLNLGKK